MELHDIPSGHRIDEEPHSTRVPLAKSLQGSDEEDCKEDSDIFRGEPPPRPASPASVSSSSSSSSSSRSGGRFTTIAAVVEQAISRWARHNDNSSDSSDSSSSRSSVVTLSRPRKVARRSRRPSLHTIHNQQSERDLAAKFRARQESRHIPREFILYQPPPGSSRASSKKFSANEEGNVPSSQRVVQTSSLSLILEQLDSALKKSKKDRRSRSHSRPMSPERSTQGPSMTKDATSQHLDYMTDPMLAPSRPASFTDLAGLPSKKGKEREGTLRFAVSKPKAELPTSLRAPKAWWLDISSPTWEDMRAIGKVRIIKGPTFLTPW